MKRSAHAIATAVTDGPVPLGTPPLTVFRGDSERHCWRYVERESLETALDAVRKAPAIYWRIEDREGRTVVSSRGGVERGVAEGAITLVARQVLRAMALSGRVQELVRELVVEGEDEIASGRVLRWEEEQESGGRWVKHLQVDRPAPAPKPLCPHTKPNGAAPPVWFGIESPSTYLPASTVTVHHSTGWMRIDPRYLELRSIAPDRDGMPRWDLVVLKTKAGDKEGTITPGKNAAGVYVQGLGIGECVEAQAVGIKLQEATESGNGSCSPRGIPRSWRPGVVRTRRAPDDPEDPGGWTERAGWVRGPYGIDRRGIEMPGYAGSTYTQMRYHLTHRGSGYLIGHYKRRTSAELVAQALIEEVRELTAWAGEDDSGPLPAGISDKAQAMIEGVKAAGGWRWDM